MSKATKNRISSPFLQAGRPRGGVAYLYRHHHLPLLIRTLPETVAGASGQREHECQDSQNTHQANHCFWPGGIMPLARSCKDGVSVAGALLPLNSAASQSPAHSLVPLTVPTSLQPIGSLGLTWASGLLPTFGGASWANVCADKQIATRTSQVFIVLSPPPWRQLQRATVKDKLHSCESRVRENAGHAVGIEDFQTQISTRRHDIRGACGLKIDGVASLFPRRDGASLSFTSDVISICDKTATELFGKLSEADFIAFFYKDFAALVSACRPRSVQIEGVCLRS
jgi:hypothetical protein